MKILYLCSTMNARHGGRTHAREFFSAIGQFEDVSIESFYEIEEVVASPSEKPNLGKMSWLPNNFRTFLKLVLTHSDRTREVSNRLSNGSYDVLLLRHENIKIDLARLKASHPNIKIAVEFNAVLSDEMLSRGGLQELSRWIELRQFRCIDKIYPVSSILKGKLIDAGVSEHRIVVNPNGVDIKRFSFGLAKKRDTFRQLYGIPEDRIVIGYVGGMEKFRQLPRLVNAFAALLRNSHHNKYLFFMVGEGADYSVVEKEFAAQCPKDSYLLLGWQSHKDVPRIMATFDLAVMPYTLDYCSPLKLFEYMAMKLPTIGPDTFAVRDLFCHGKHLWLVDQSAEGVKDLVVLFEKIADDVSFRRQVASAGYACVRENYTWQANAGRVLAGLK